MKIYRKHNSQTPKYQLLHFLRASLSTSYKLLTTILTLPRRLLPHRLMRKLNSTQRLFVNMIVVGVLLVFGVFIATSFLNPEQTKAAWWDQSWLYRQTAIITNSNGSDLDNYQITITVDTSTLISAGKMKSDCSDIRITNRKGKILPIWIETGANACNTSSTHIWIKTIKIPIATSEFIFYYGNPQAKSVSDGNKVFELFDDFSGSTLNTSKWDAGTIGATSGTNFSVSSGVLTGGNTNRYIQSKAMYSGNYATEARTYTTTIATNGFSPVGFYASSSNGFGLLDHNGTSYYRNDSNWVNFSVNGTSQWTRNTAKVVGTSATYARIGETSGSSTATITNSGLSSEYVRISARYDDAAMDQNYAASWDWIFVRKAVTTEPTSTLGSEEYSRGPIGYWSMDEGSGTTVHDATQNKNDGTITGASWQSKSDCIQGKCLYFDGVSNQKVDFGAMANVPLTGDLTISFWMKPTNLARGRQNPVSKSYTAEFQFTLETSGSLSYYHGNGGTYTSFGSPAIITQNKWQHVVLTRNASTRTLSYFINGKLTNSTTYSGTYDPVTSGSAFIIGDGYAGDFQGYLDEVKIYASAETPTEVQADYNHNSAAVLGAKDNSVLSNGLVGYWKMDEASYSDTSGEVIDSSGTANNGTPVNGAEASTSAKFGNAGYFAGTGKYISLGTPRSMTSRSYSVWVKPNAGASAAGRDGIFGENGGTRIDYGNGTGSTSFHALILLTAGSPNYKELTGTGNGTSDWSHLVLTLDNAQGVGKLYVNGVLASTATWDTTTQSVNTSGAQYLAYVNNLANYNGNLDEARIYNRALTPDDVAKLYTFAPGPIYYAPLDEGSGTTASDISGNNYNTTLTGTPTWTQGKFGKALEFSLNSSDKASATISTGPLSRLNNNTVSYWIKFTGANDSNYRRVFGLSVGASDRAPGIWTCPSTTNKFHWRMDPSNSGFNCLGTDGDNGSTFEVGKWYYVAVTKDETIGTAYVNGTKVATTTLSNPITSGTGTLEIGATGYTSAGMVMDEIRVYDYARNQGQVISDMNGGHPLGGSPIGSQALYYKFDEGYGALAHDSAPFPANGTLGCQGTGCILPEWKQDGRFGKALYFNSANTANNPTITINTSTYTKLRTLGDVTISAWINPSSSYYDTSEAILRQGQGADEEYALFYSPTSKSFNFSWYDGSWKAVSTPSNLVPLNQWSYVAAVRSGTTVYLYVNGKLVGSGAVTAPTVNASLLSIGRTNNEGVPQDYSGYIDELKIYTAALTSDQIKIDYNRGSSLSLGTLGSTSNGSASSSASTAYCIPGDTTSCNPPVAEWSFEEKSGSTTNDTSGNGNTGTLTGTPTWSSGKIGGGLLFDSSGGDAMNTTGVTIGSTWTISTWTKFPLTTTGGYRTLVRNGSGIHHILVDSSGLLGTYNGSFASSGYDVDSLSSGWHYLTSTGSGGATNFYIDGNLVGASAQQITSSIKEIGNAGGSQQWGAIDAMRIYNYVRTPSQIAYDYNRGAPVAHYKLDECQGSVVHSSNDAYDPAFNGTITIGAAGTQTTVGTCTTPSTAWGNGAAGKFNHSLNFDGTDDWIDGISQPPFQASPNLFTVSGWIKPGAQDGFLITPNSNGVDQWIGYDTDLQRLWVSVATASDTNQVSYYSSSYSVPANTWTNFILSINDRTVKIYINGILNKQVTHGFDIGGWTGNWRIGQRGNSTNWYLGQLDDLQVFNYELTSQQVKGVYNQNSSIRFGPSNGTP